MSKLTIESILKDYSRIQDDDKLLDKVVNEWFYRLPAGIAEAPYSDSELRVLREVLEEQDMDSPWPTEEVLVQEDSIPDEEPEDVAHMSKSEVKILKQAFKEIKESYSRYLTIFNYFDSNSLGTVSEVLLAKLLNKTKTVKASHVGGGQGLSDIDIQIGTSSKGVSLKTTDSKQPINLGSDKTEVDTAAQKYVTAFLRTYHNSVEGASKGGKKTKGTIHLSHTLGQILKFDPKDPANAEVEMKDMKYLADNKRGAEQRIDSIVKKLASPDDLFVWIEKITKGKALEAIQIHVKDYKEQKVKDKFLESYPYATENAWGLYSGPDGGGVKYVDADLTGKILNIHPNFVRDTVEETGDGVRVDLQVSSSETISDDVSDSLLSALDDIYSKLFAG